MTDEIDQVDTHGIGLVVKAHEIAGRIKRNVADSYDMDETANMLDPDHHSYDPAAEKILMRAIAIRWCNDKHIELYVKERTAA